MSATAAALVKAAILALTDENTRKKIGWVLAAILSPVILLIAFLCALGSGTASHNLSVVELWYDALSRHLKDETVEDKLGDYLDQLINELVPEQEYSRISQELWQEDRQARQELEAARKFAIFRIRESGQDRCLQVERPLEFLDAARLLRSYLRGERGASSFEQMLHQAEEITPEAFEDMVLVRMENTGKVTGTFELDFDKREFSAVNVMDGWQTFAMGDVSKAVYQADRKAHLDSDQRWVRFLDALDGRQITSAGHLSAREVRMAEEISEVDGLLNFYLETSFDVDAVFGTQVCTAENGDWLNVYAWRWPRL